jgi:hypothetical protein
MLGLQVPVPKAPAALASSLPQGALHPLEFYCSRGQGLPGAKMAWHYRTVEILFLPFALPPVFERVDNTPVEEKRSGGAFGEILTIANAYRSRTRKAARHLPRAIAASVLVGSVLWLGSHTLNLSRRVVNRDASTDIAGNIGSLTSATSRGSAARPSVFSSPAAWVRSAVARRAAVQVTDTFKRGMAAWGVVKGWAPGWSRHPDGYVRPGQLALFQPTLNYTNYRLEFFGQIESRGMGWVVRAQDRQNYYAMKFKVIEPGLRPVLSMVYYPVLGGKAGHKVEVPLSVMVHNNTPYHVAVEVSGKRLTTSVEGQEVETWVDDALPSGGVGFFTEAGERARLYWMRVARNDDWLGRVCAFLSGNSVEEAQETARFERSGLPQPVPGREAPVSQALLAAGEGVEILAGSGKKRAGRSAAIARRV